MGVRLVEYLATVRENLQRLASDPEWDAEALAATSLVGDATTGSTRMAERLVQMAGSAASYEVIDLHRRIRAMSGDLTDTLADGVDFSLEVGGGEAPALIDPAQFDLLLAQLVSLAGTGLEEGDALTITTDIRDDEAAVLGGSMLASRNLAIHFRLQGPGARDAAEILEDPVVQALVGSVGTAMTFEIEDDHNVEMTFALSPPRASSTAQRTGDAAPASGESSGAVLPEHVQPTVLLVDDNRRLLRMLRRFLEFETDWRVLTASGPAEAEETWKANRDHISVMISDIDMPGGDGPTLIERLRADHGMDIPVILISGRPDTHEGLSHLERDGRTRVLEKPFDPLELLGQLRTSVE